MPTYRASVNLDFTGHRTYHYQKLMTALIATGWKYVETSALVITTKNLGKVWCGIELVARQAQSCGTLSALTFHIQSSTNFRGLPYQARVNHPNAVQNIMAKQFPAP